MKVLVAAAEALPFWKTGGLGDVARALPDALVARGLEVRVIMPGYPFIATGPAPLVDDGTLDVPWPGGHRSVGFRRHAPDDVAGTVFVQAPEFFGTGRPYDDVAGDPFGLARRFAFFCRATVAYARHWGADVLHLNDWQCGLAPVYAMLDGLDAATLFTIHNLAYQGNFDAEALPHLGIPPAFMREENGVAFWGGISFMKAGISLADGVSTVSPSYAAEICTPEGGFGLDGLLRFRRRRLAGILNGIDTATWNPLTDPLLPANYGARGLQRKDACRAALSEGAGVDGSGTLLGMVTRLAHQKGIDLLLTALPGLLERGCSLVVLGHGDGHYEQALRAAAAHRPDRLAVHTGFADELAHLVYAGSDLFLMPSLYEPCGLGQMIAQRYGTPPIARRTGGLADTITDGATGFLFNEPTADALLEAVDRAAAARGRRGWRALQARCMREDHSWTRSAAVYERLYHAARSILPQSA